MSPKELPAYLVPHLLIAYTRQLEILQASNFTHYIRYSLIVWLSVEHD